MAHRGGSGKSYSGGGTQGHVPKKKVTVSYVIRDEEEPLNRSGVNALRIDPGTRRLYTAGRDSIIRCWDISSQDECEYVQSLEHHTDWVNDIVLCMQGQYIMSASSDITLKLWDAVKGTCCSTLRQQQDYIKCLAYAKQKQVVASGSLDKSIYVWDLETLTSLTSKNRTVTTIPLRGQNDSVYSLAMNDSGTVLVAGGTDKVLQVWDPRGDNKTLMRLKGHTDNVRALLLNPDGTTCVSGSSDGTVRLWSLGQQRCIETFRMHEEGVWALAADEAFQTVYSGGRDRKVYAIELSQGVEGTLLFTEDAPVLSLTPDPCDSKESLWVSTTETHVNKWTFDPDATDEKEGGEGEGEMEGEGEEDMEVTNIDDFSPSFMKLSLQIPGGPSIREYRILGDRQHVLTRNSNDHVQLWDVLHAVKEEDLGVVDLDEEVERRKCKLYTSNWFSVEVKTGMLSIKLSEIDCFSAWVMGTNTNLDTATPDLKLNLGALVLRALFEHWPDANPLPASSENERERDRTEEKGGEAGTKSGDQQSDTGTTGSGGQQSERSARRSEADGEQERSVESGVEGGGKREEEGKKDKKEQKKKENGGKQKKDKNKKYAPPKLEQVMSECDEVKEWVELGAALHMPQSDLDIIENAHSDDPARCRRELFKLWLKGSDDMSWEVLTAALVSSGHSKLADKMREKYLTAASESPPPTPTSVSPPVSVNGGNTDKVNIKFFSVPPHTPIVVAESGDCATTLVRMQCRDACRYPERRQLHNCCPQWVKDTVIERKLPDHHKMNFNLGKYVVGGKDQKNSKSNSDRLSAQDILTVRKVQEYVYSKMEPKKGSEGEQGPECFEILCHDQVLDRDLDLRTVRYKYWKSGGDMKLFYRVAEERMETVAEGKSEEEERGEEEGEGEEVEGEKKAGNKDSEMKEEEEREEAMEGEGGSGKEMTDSKMTGNKNDS